MKTKRILYSVFYITFLLSVIFSFPSTAADRKGFQKINGAVYYYKNGSRIKNQFKKIKGYTYYFDSTGKMAVTVKYIDKQFWVFDAQGHLMSGKSDHIVKLKKYSYVVSKDGTGVSGKIRVRGKLYLTDKRGRILKQVKSLNGLVRIKGKLVFYSKGKRLREQWRTWQGYTYYFKKNSVAAHGPYLINGICYIFDENGHLLLGEANRTVTVNGTIYLVSKDGKALTGWQMINNQLYCGNLSGKAVTEGTVNGVSFNADGTAVNNQVTALKRITMPIVARITNPAMSQSQKLYACWSYIVGGSFSYAGKYPNLGQRGWQTQLAINMLTTHSGNCYGFACGFAALAAEVGYRPYVVCGRCPGSRDGAADGYTRHSWVIINGAHYDPEAQYAGWSRGIYGSGGAAGYIQSTVDFVGSN